MIETESNIRAKVKQLLEEGTIKYFIGYEKGSDIIHSTPCFIKNPKDVERLVWNPFCLNNLVGFLIEDKKRELKKDEKPDTRPVGILVKGCDCKSIVQLISENKIARDEVIIYGVSCPGVIDPKKFEALLKEKNIDVGTASDCTFKDDGDNYTITLGNKKLTVSKKKVLFDKCNNCTNPTPELYDELFGNKIESGNTKDYAGVEEIESLSLEKRWDFWSEHFSRCIRCSACKNVCPSCYCKECVVDTADVVITPKTTYKEKANKSVWIEKNVDLPENIFFHLTRMMHMAGRCITCGECERVCPMNIPLSLLTRKLEKDVKEMFDYETGIDTEAKPLLSIFEEDDPGDFIK